MVMLGVKLQKVAAAAVDGGWRAGGAEWKTAGAHIPAIEERGKGMHSMWRLLHSK